MVRYLSLEEVLILHEKTIVAIGGSQGIRDQALVESALARPQAGYGEYEAYPDIFSKAAVLLEGLIKNHGFVDGNKRSAVVVTIIFLSRNGFKLEVEQTELVNTAVNVAENQLSADQIAVFLKNKARKAE